MNVDLEALCKAYLMFLDSEFCDRLDSEIEYKMKETKVRLHRFEGLSEEEAESHEKTYGAGMMEGFLTVATELRRLISIEMSNEHREFEKDLGYVCPYCGDRIMIPQRDHIPVLDGIFIRSYECQMCGFSRELPKAILVRDIFTEYANKEKEKEKEAEE